jgi:hypothetical protein
MLKGAGPGGLPVKPMVVEVVGPTDGGLNPILAIW